MTTLGSATLIAGTATVANTSVTATTHIFLSHQNASGTLGIPYISAITPGVNFVITSTNVADTSLILWSFSPPNNIALLANPPATVPLINETSTIKNVPVLAPSIVDSGVNDTWLKWMGQVTQIVNLLVNAVNGS